MVSKNMIVKAVERMGIHSQCLSSSLFEMTGGETTILCEECREFYGLPPEKPVGEFRCPCNVLGRERVIELTNEFRKEIKNVQ